MSAFDLSSCLELVRQGDQEASRLLIEHLYSQVIRIVRSHLPRRTAEEDLVQQIFIKLFERLPQYRPQPGAAFEHWLSRLAVRTCLDALRRERRRPELRHADMAEEELAWLEHVVASAPEPSQDTAASARDFVERLLSALSPADRLVITLLDLEERSVKEISALTGWSVPGVKVRAFRARRRLRRLAEGLGATGAGTHE
jgi:RNA polymerase sigma-70 factor (ECF subfamily)